MFISTAVYSGEYLDLSRGEYYLRARHFNPTTGRFTQPDPHWTIANMVFGNNPRRMNEREDPLGLNHYTMVPDIWAIMQAGNLYVYTMNNPVMWVDPSGEIAASASSTVREGEDPHGNTRHFVTTTVRAPLRGSETVEWWVTHDGFIQFDFRENNYWGVLWRGGAEAFAAELFHVTRGINSDFLSGRTIGGLEADMNIHWAASFFNHQWDPFIARMGGTIPGQPGFDNNAWVFESANVISRATNFLNPFSALAVARELRYLTRYIRL